MLIGERSAVAIDPDGPDARVARAGDVAVEAVANHHRLMRGDLQSFQHQLKDSAVGFSESVAARDDDRLEKAREVRTVDLGALDLGRAVSDQSEAKIRLQSAQHRFRFGKHHVAAPRSRMKTSASSSASARSSTPRSCSAADHDSTR